MSKFVYAIEGLDRLGKSTLIEGIQQELGFFQVIHFGKPKRLKKYDGSIMPSAIEFNDGMVDPSLYHYQAESFRNSFKLAQSGARVIFDRWHLGEAVYANMYRHYDGNYVFEQEHRYSMDTTNFTRLILLTEDFSKSKHFVSDGESFDDSRRGVEQAFFINAFNKSIIRDKRIICVTADDGGFRPAADILAEALEHRPL